MPPANTGNPRNTANAPLMSKRKQEVFLHYEDYIENTLRKDLEDSLQKSKLIALKLEEVRTLRANVQALKKKHDTNWNDPASKSMDSLIN